MIGRVVALAGLFLIVRAPLHAEVLVPEGASWRYHAEGQDLGTAWREPAYDDIAWPAGPAELGYGDGDEATLVGWGPSTTNRYVTTYFRTAFWVVEPERFAACTLRLRRDDGAAVYLNGVEIARSNLAVGAAWAKTASANVVGTGEAEWVPFALDPARLLAGDNLLAVEVHQVSVSSPDLSFALTLECLPPPPAVQALAPAPSSTGQPGTATLSVRVDDSQGSPLDVTFLGRVRPPEGEFVVAMLPDTQFYSGGYPEIFAAQTAWLAANADLPIAFVTHVGDVVDVATVPEQWLAADAAMSLLDGVLPYGLAPGNHDTPTTQFNQVFPFTRYENEPWYGGHLGDTNDSSYQLVSMGGVDLLFLHLAWCPSAEVIAWGAQVLAEHPDRLAVVSTHGYLDTAGNRAVGLCSNTQVLWDLLVAPSPNVRLVLCGHIYGTGYRRDLVGERAVHQMLFDTQYDPNGGDGWLRLLHFVPADDAVHVETFSPWLQQNRADAANAFTLDVPQGPAWTRLATRTGVPAGQVVSVAWSGLEGGASYQWRVLVRSPAGGAAETPRAAFTTLPAIRVAKVALLPGKAGGHRYATARVKVDPPLANAKVRGAWFRDGALLKAAASATTGPTGLATLTSPARKAGTAQVFTFRVTSVVRTGYLYAPSKNLKTEGSITVP